VLRSSPDFDGVDLIDPAALGWLSGVDASQYLSSDGYHPSPEGDQLIAHLLTEALRAERITDPS
jgi:lysophospholipase L1-like esterase